MTAGSPFSDLELERYARHIVLREIGGAGQRRLKEARVLVVGAGGLGSPALLYLAAAGVGQLVVVDDDRVSLSNLQRQLVHGTADVGAPKTVSARAMLERINPEIKIDTWDVRLDDALARERIRDFEAVLDGSDNFETRHAVNAAACRNRVPLVSGAIATWDGVVTVCRPWLGTPCWRCLNPEWPDADAIPSCAEAGVLGSLAGAIGSMMATECVKLITGAGRLLENRMLLLDALYGETRMIGVKPRPDCPVCGRGEAQDRYSMEGSTRSGGL